MFLGGCDKDNLELTNPNEPTFENLKSEAGMLRLGLGIYAPMREDAYFWIPWGYHQSMADIVTISAGNFSFRFANQTSEIIDPDGKIFTPTTGGSQPNELRSKNTRLQGDNNAFKYEWETMYLVNGIANTILENVETAIYTGNADIKKKALKTWAYWWKGYAYSKIGAMYAKGLIINKLGEANNKYVSKEEILNEAKKNFDLAKALLSGISENDQDFAAVMSYVVPAYLKKGKGGDFTPKMLERNINTFLARNVLINKYATSLTNEDLDQIENLCKSGITKTDKVFTVRQGSIADLVGTGWSPARLANGWENLSERFVQDFRQGDNRKARNIETMEDPIINPRGRGYQYGTRFSAIDGGEYCATDVDIVETIMSCSFEENQLMLAEVYIRRGDIEKGLSYIDEVREYQKAELPKLIGNNLDKEKALEELRSERRVGLFQKGPVCFYDARRWGILKPLSEGGGRKNANVVFNGGIVKPCTINYNYLEYFDIPANETDFNPISLKK